MKNLYSLFLSQAYRDCWDDYNRSLKLKNFPKWDYVILTASNEQQAEGFRKQIEERKAFLPKETTFVAIPDRDGKRVGSGGATLETLPYKFVVKILVRYGNVKSGKTNFAIFIINSITVFFTIFFESPRAIKFLFYHDYLLFHTFQKCFERIIFFIIFLKYFIAKFCISN